MPVRCAAKSEADTWGGGGSAAQWGEGAAPRLRPGFRPARPRARGGLAGRRVPPGPLLQQPDLENERCSHRDEVFSRPTTPPREEVFSLLSEGSSGAAAGGRGRGRCGRRAPAPSTPQMRAEPSL